jgi:hypothetical protein
MTLFMGEKKRPFKFCNQYSKKELENAFKGKILVVSIPTGKILFDRVNDYFSIEYIKEEFNLLCELRDGTSKVKRSRYRRLRARVL